MLSIFAAKAPGQLGYGIKRFEESVATTLAPTSGLRNRSQLDFADRRITEIATHTHKSGNGVAYDEAEPEPSYLDKEDGGLENTFTNRNTTFTTWNLPHTTKMIKDSGGIPAYGNQHSEWDAGARFDFENPEYQ